MRPCTCDNTKIGQHYTLGECRACWLFHHAPAKNREWGGDGKVAKLPQRSAAEVNEYRAQRQKEIRNNPRPGTHLARMISYFGVSKRGCGGCTGMAADMDKGGPDWCRKNMDKILGHMAEQAWKKGIPFFRAGGVVLIERAIAAAEAESALKIGALK